MLMRQHPVSARHLIHTSLSLRQLKGRGAVRGGQHPSSWLVAEHSAYRTRVLRTASSVNRNTCQPHAKARHGMNRSGLSTRARCTGITPKIAGEALDHHQSASCNHNAGDRNHDDRHERPLKPGGILHAREQQTRQEHRRGAEQVRQAVRGAEDRDNDLG